MYSKAFTGLLMCCSLGLLFCRSQVRVPVNDATQYNSNSANPVPSSVADIPLPDGFSRITYSNNSFAHWLRQLSLKKDRTVYLFDGRVKSNQTAQYAVIDISVGNKDLQHCADAAMRLRAEFLYAQKEIESIRFTDNEAGVYTFQPPHTRVRFDAYLQQVFGMCGTASLAKQMRTQKFVDMQPGDLLIRGGFPGHAVTVMDMAINSQGEKIYLLSQSYMPAQNIHILNNPSADGSPWYQLSATGIISTPEYHFYDHELKGWE